MNKPVKIKVVIGLIEGKTWCSNSCTRPPVFEPGVVLAFHTTEATLSAMLYNVQKFGAQYAWHSPRLNGNNRDST